MSQPFSVQAHRNAACLPEQLKASLDLPRLGADQPVAGGLVLRPRGRALELVLLDARGLEHPLHHVHVVQGAHVAGAGQRHLGAAQRDAGLHGRQGLQRLERGPGVDGGGDVAKFGHHGAVGRQEHSRADVPGLHKAASFNDGQFDGGVHCEGGMRVVRHSASLGAGHGDWPGYSTVTMTDCQPDAPSGTGSARWSVCTSPVPSVARTLM